MSGLRARLILAFVSIALLAGLFGVVALLFVDRVSKTVAVFSDVTSPLLSESVALVGNAQRMRASFLGAIDESDNGRYAEALAALHDSSRAQLDRLRSLAAAAKVDLKLDAAEQRESDFVKTIGTTLAADRRVKELRRSRNEQIAGFENQLVRLGRLLVATTNRAQGRMSKAEDEIKVAVQSGNASAQEIGERASYALTEIYPVLQSGNKLMHENGRLREAVKWYLAQDAVTFLDATEQEVRTAFKGATAAVRKLAGRLRDADGRVEIANISRAFDELQERVLGAQGLFASHREFLAAEADAAAGRASLDQMERSYFATLDEVAAVVQGLNLGAKREVGRGIAQAPWMVVAGALGTILISLVVGLLLSRRITRPLLRLAGHVGRIRHSGELVPLVDAAITERGDEIGTLARSFNLMISELGDARRKLIAWSEAEIRTQYERLDAAINNMPIGLCMFDAKQELIICNKRYGEIYGLEPSHMVPGTPLREILDHRATGIESMAEAQAFVQERLTSVEKRKPWYLVTDLPNGHVIAIAHQPLPNGGSVATHEDITERRKAEQQIAYMAHHDSLTDLPNRVLFREELVKALSRVGRGETAAVLCIDLDYFKTVNDTLGHPVGDELLRQVARRLTECVRPTDVIARLGGDEFAIVQVCEQPVGATALATRLIKTISQPYEIDGHQVVVGASVGIALAPNDGNDPDALLKNADLALYRAKEDGRGRYCFFEPEMDARMQARRALELDLRKALALDEFALYYQPLVNLETNKLSGCEALLRWCHPQRGMVPPAEFIPLAEEIGLIGPIGAWVLKQACIEAATWPEDLHIAVNLSPLQFKSGTIVLDVVAALGASGLKPSRLELEITETTLLQDTEATVTMLQQLRDLGVRISMDDFGTGYSSLGYLRKFPFDKIKIDQSFIRDLGENADSIAIVRAVAGLGRGLGIATTAEGVETKEQLRRVREEGCTEAQGFLFSEPRSAEELPALFARLPRKSAA
jgi:diguanylate cyclase (GGDEF)-like protein